MEKIFDDGFNSVHLFTSFFSSFFYRLLFKSPHHTHIQRWTEWHGHTTQNWMTWHGLEPLTYRTTGTHHNHSTTTRTTQKNFGTSSYRNNGSCAVGITISHHACALRILPIWMPQSVPAFTVSRYTLPVCWPAQFSANVKVKYQWFRSFSNV